MDTTIFIIKYQFLSHQEQKTWIPVFEIHSYFWKPRFSFPESSKTAVFRNVA